MFDTTLGLAVKVFDGKDALAHLVKFLDAPAAMIDVAELRKRIAMGIQ